MPPEERASYEAVNDETMEILYSADHGEEERSQSKTSLDSGNQGR